MFNFSSVEKSAQKNTKLTLEQIKFFSPSQLRDHLISIKKRKFLFVSEFPYIGRGNVLREKIIDSASLNNEIDKILK